jgi:hypothetical protein
MAEVRQRRATQPGPPMPRLTLCRHSAARPQGGSEDSCSHRWQDSNLHSGFRRPSLCPLSYSGSCRAGLRYLAVITHQRPPAGLAVAWIVDCVDDPPSCGHRPLWNVGEIRIGREAASVHESSRVRDDAIALRHAHLPLSLLLTVMRRQRAFIGCSAARAGFEPARDLQGPTRVATGCFQPDSAILPGAMGGRCAR